MQGEQMLQYKNLKEKKRQNGYRSSPPVTSATVRMYVEVQATQGNQP